MLKFPSLQYAHYKIQDTIYNVHFILKHGTVEQALEELVMIQSLVQGRGFGWIKYSVHVYRTCTVHCS